MQNKNEPKNKSEPKKSWNSPMLIVYGPVESLTQAGCNKNYGDGDGFTFQNNPIQCTS